MPNSDLVHKTFNVDNPTVSDYLDGSDEISYTNATTIKNRLEEKGQLDSNESVVLKWVDKLLGQETDNVYREKDIQRKAGKENVFKKTHHKDKDNKGLNKIGGLVDVRSGPRTGVNHQIYHGKMNYHESLESEIDAMKYLIEYMCNNKKKIIK